MAKPDADQVPTASVGASPVKPKPVAPAPDGLAAGTVLGPYRIVARVGAGGMGEVYRARDERLERDVAVKVLLAGRHSDEALRRFEIEARAACAISHPNVLAIYDTGVHEGAPFVVSELLEGETLRARMPISARKAIAYMRQVVDGLAAAHDKGIIHRDLKPENIFVTAADHVKILDFGLAKTVAEADVEPDDGTERALTKAGSVMGTAGYMAPEQVRGEAVDPRADLFAAGAILYELCAGERAFPGKTAMDRFTATLMTEPAGLSGLPQPVQRVIARCLEKRPAQRFGNARELAFALEGLVVVGSSSQGSQSSPALAPVVVPASSLPKNRRRWPWLLAALAIGVAAGAGGWRVLGVKSASPPPHFQRLSFRRGWIGYARFAPDGQTVYAEARWSESSDKNTINVFHTDSPESQILPLQQGAGLDSVSTSGELAVLLQPMVLDSTQLSGTLARVAAGGGAPREVVTDVEEADFVPGTSELAIIRSVDGKERIEYPIGKALYETASMLWQLRFSPDGRQLATVSAGNRTRRTGDELTVVDLEGHARVLGQFDHVLGLELGVES